MGVHTIGEELAEKAELLRTCATSLRYMAHNLSGSAREGLLQAAEDVDRAAAKIEDQTGENFATGVPF